MIEVQPHALQNQTHHQQATMGSSCASQPFRINWNSTVHSICAEMRRICREILNCTGCDNTLRPPRWAAQRHDTARPDCPKRLSNQWYRFAYLPPNTTAHDSQKP